MADTLATAATPDFVNVQLTAEAIAFAKNGPLRFSNGRREFTFTPGVPQKVELQYEWKRLLSLQVLQDGKPILELAPTVASAAATTPAAAPAAATPAAASTATKS